MKTSLLKLARSCTLFLLLCVGGVSAYANPNFPSWYDSTTGFGLNNTIPDFYQHQSEVFGLPISDPKYPGKEDGGLCLSTAFLDVIYSLDSRYPDLKLYKRPPLGGPWLSDMVTNLVPVANKTPNAPPPTSYFQDYLSSPLLKPNQSWSVTKQDDSGVDFDIFNDYKKGLLAGHSVLIYLEPGGATKWWWNKYHVLAGVGLHDKSHGFVFADPDNTIYPIDADHPADNNHGFDVANQSSGNYNYSSDSFPSGGTFDFGIPFDKHDDKLKYYQGFTVDKNGVIQDGIYKDAKVKYIYDIALVVPEPSVVWLFAPGVLVVLWATRRSPKPA